MVNINYNRWNKRKNYTKFCGLKLRNFSSSITRLKGCNNKAVVDKNKSNEDLDSILENSVFVRSGENLNQDNKVENNLFSNTFFSESEFNSSNTNNVVESIVDTTVSDKAFSLLYFYNIPFKDCLNLGLQSFVNYMPNIDLNILSISATTALLLGLIGDPFINIIINYRTVNNPIVFFTNEVNPYDIRYTGHIDYLHGFSRVEATDMLENFRNMTESVFLDRLFYSDLPSNRYVTVGDLDLSDEHVEFLNHFTQFYIDWGNDPEIVDFSIRYLNNGILRNDIIIGAHNSDLFPRIYNAMSSFIH